MIEERTEGRRGLKEEEEGTEDIKGRFSKRGHPQPQGVQNKVLPLGKVIC